MKPNDILCAACDERIDGDARNRDGMKFCEQCFTFSCRCGEREEELIMDEFGDYECRRCRSERIQQIMMESNGVRV